MEDQKQACPACKEKRRHAAEEWREFHPYAGHGCIDGRYTHPDLEPVEE